MKTLLASIAILCTACGSSEEMTEETYGKGWTKAELVNLSQECVVASDGLFPEVTDYVMFCDCWTAYVVERIDPVNYKEKTFAVLQLLGNAPRQACAK
jgi:hypothetical protein